MPPGKCALLEPIRLGYVRRLQPFGVLFCTGKYYPISFLMSNVFDFTPAHSAIASFPRCYSESTALCGGLVMLGAKCLRPSYLGNEKNAHSTPMRSCCSPGGFANDSESVTKRKSFCHLFFFSLTFKYLILSMFLFIVSYISLGISEVVIKINMNSMMLIGNVNCFCCSDIFGICCSNNAKMNAIIRLNNILNIWNFTRFCSFGWVCIIVLHECV